MESPPPPDETSSKELCLQLVIASSNTPESTDHMEKSREPLKSATNRFLQFGTPTKVLTKRKIQQSPSSSTVKAQEISRREKNRRRFSKSPIKSPLKPKIYKKHKWTDDETKALVEYVAMPSELWVTPDTGKWPMMEIKVNQEGPDFWAEAAKYIADKCGEPLRTDNSVRTKVTKDLQKKFPLNKGGVASAEKHYGLNIDSYLGLDMPRASSSSVTSRAVSAPAALSPAAPSPAVPPVPARQVLGILQERLGSTVPPATERTQIQTVPDKSIIEHLKTYKQQAHVSFIKDYANILDNETLEEVTNMLFLILAEAQGVHSNPCDFATIATKGMVRLQEAGKPNVIHHFAKCLGEDRTGTTEPLMPLHRMPFGLVEYKVEFFSSTNARQVKTPTDYRHWLQMMDSEFGERFFKLFRGPMWSGFTVDDPEMRDPLEARVNVASISHRAIASDFKSSKFTTTPVIQEESLKQLKEANPNGRFWIKVDGTDVKTALQESHKRDWNGDVDMLDGTLQALKSEYLRRRQSASSELPDKEKVLEELSEDKKFLLKKLETTAQDYNKKTKLQSTAKDKLKDLNWTLVEISNLIKKNDELTALYSSDENLSVRHKGIEEDHLDYLRYLYTKKRTPATHVLVLMLSDELRQIKPYALPVQYIPYHSLKDAEVSEICQNLKAKMKEYDLTCVGTVTDGEFSTLRTKGWNRPVHVVEVISNVRAYVDRKGKKALRRMLTISGENTDIPDEVVKKIATAKKKKARRAALLEVRGTLVSKKRNANDSISTWRRHCPETTKDLMKTIVAVYSYKAKLAAYKAEGVDFYNNFFVPEKDPITGIDHYHREDPNHELKRIVQHTRDGKFDKISASRFYEAMRSKDTDLTHPALIGTRKQSVRDAEKFLSHAVAAFFLKKGYTAEAEYVKVIADWHEATDGRGMTQQERSNANMNFRNYILQDWTPWWSEECDLSDLDINRPLDTVCGFSRETLVGVLANIDTQEDRRKQEDRPPEHPRASTTDDVECFFSLSHRKGHGQNLTLKEWKYNWRKLIWEFTNRLDPNLPFWYWTLNERFSASEEMLSFDQPTPDAIPRLHQVQHRSREDSSIMVAGRACLPVQHLRSCRDHHHKGFASLPEVPDELQDRVQQLIQEIEDGDV